MDAAAAAEEGGETAGFECNICFGLAEDPVITRCGHLHCWPCLCEWLRFHSQCHECPVCKAVIREEELIPLNGRGDTAFHRRPPPDSDIRLIRPRVVRVRLREFSGYGWYGGEWEGEENSINNGDNMKKIIFFILLFVVFDFLII